MTDYRRHVNANGLIPVTVIVGKVDGPGANSLTTMLEPRATAAQLRVIADQIDALASPAPDSDLRHVVVARTYDEGQTWARKYLGMDGFRVTVIAQPSDAASRLRNYSHQRVALHTAYVPAHVAVLDAIQTALVARAADMTFMLDRGRAWRTLNGRGE